MLLNVQDALQQTCMAMKVYFGFIYTPLQVTQLRRSKRSCSRMKMARAMCELRRVLTYLFMGVCALPTRMFLSAYVQIHAGMQVALSRVSDTQNMSREGEISL